MISIHFLGNFKKRTGCSSLEYDKYPASINDIISFVNRSASNAGVDLRQDNLLMAVNGVDSSVLNADEKLLQDGDLVTIVPVVHGG
ncbi:MAG: MoaD/ThiS family protein [Thermoproteota archaeon]|nr:MoaD/ThiS family protein [Thermoproteota archaeon]